MSSRYPKKAPINLGESYYEIEGLFESELGFLMLRLHNLETNSYLTYNLGKHNASKNFITDQIKDNENNSNNLLG